MNAARRQRLLIVLFILVGVGLAVTLALFALRENINLYYSPTQVLAGEAPAHARIRGGGLVVPGSLVRDADSLKVRFAITDGAATMTVTYEGILPDLFREGQGIVATGRLNTEGVLEAEEVLAKHDENYMPPEVQEAIDKAHGGGDASEQENRG